MVFDPLTGMDTETPCARGCGRVYHATYGNVPLCLQCRSAPGRAKLGKFAKKEAKKYAARAACGGDRREGARNPQQRQQRQQTLQLAQSLAGHEAC